MSRWGCIGVLALLAALSSVRPAEAQTLGPVVAGSGVTDSNASSAFTSSFSGGQQFAAPFTLGADATIAGIRAWGIGSTSPPLSLRLFAISGGVPSTTPLHSFTTAGGVTRTLATPYPDAGSTTQYQFEIPVPATALASGDYLLSITGFAWTYRNGGSLRHRPTEGGAWNTSTLGTMAFQLTGEPPAAVPERGAALLFLPALGVIALVRRKK